jgi:crotonobetainyl-CoA:carnitine CoA-transferase CaiB-like acyl-CoA transferase
VQTRKLPSTFAVATAATATVAAATLSAARLWRERDGTDEDPMVRVDARDAAIAFRSERYLRIDGAPLPALDRLTGDFPARDGWVRLHCNYPNHRNAALRALGLSTDDPDAVATAVSKRDAVATAVSKRDAVETEEAILGAGGAAAALRSPAHWRTHPQSRAISTVPLVAVDQLDPTPPDRLPPADRPLRGVRVLDLTRVIAGPVAGRTLAAHGAQVLRVGADHLPLVPALVVDTGFGKRFCHIDLRAHSGRETLRRLIAEADVVVQAFRPGALARLGLGPLDCARLRPGLVYVDVSAWGQVGPWRGRRGFDSLVQMASGIADEGRAAAGEPHGPPRHLPAQVLDHATGFLPAFGAIEGLRRRHAHSGSWHVHVSLARTANWLAGLARVPSGLSIPDPGLDDVADLEDEAPTPFGVVRHVRPPGTITGAPPHWDSPPRRPGSDLPTWLA